MSEVTNTKRIYFVRHGESTGNALAMSQDAETPLSDTGHKQAIRIAERVKNLDVELLVSSDMKRALETSSYISKTKKLPIEISPYFHERLTPLSARNKSIQSEEYKSYILGLEQNVTDPSWKLEGMENYIDLISRVDKGLDFLTNHPANSIVVVTHGTFLKHFIARMLFGDLLNNEIMTAIIKSFDSANTGMTMVSGSNKNWRLITWNDQSHFAE